MWAGVAVMVVVWGARSHLGILGVDRQDRESRTKLSVCSAAAAPNVSEAPNLAYMPGAPGIGT